LLNCAIVYRSILTFTVREIEVRHLLEVSVGPELVGLDQGFGLAGTDLRGSGACCHFLRESRGNIWSPSQTSLDEAMAFDISVEAARETVPMHRASEPVTPTLTTCQNCGILPLLCWISAASPMVSDMERTEGRIGRR